MNYQRMASMLFFSAIVFFWASCNSGESENKETSDTTTANTQATTPSTPTPVNTVVTTPQDMMVVTHKVKDFNKFFAVYEAHDSLRLANGIHNYVVGRGLTDSNMVLVVVNVDDVKKAQAFAKSPELRKAMQQSGAVGNPNIKFTTMVYRDTAVYSVTTLRSRTTFSVKDWNVFRSAFDSGRQQRKDNGVVDRAYGYDVNDNHKVTVVVAITDSTKAFAFWKSDELKQKMKAAGAIGQPQRFLYNIVKRY